MTKINVNDCIFSEYASVVQHMTENNYYSLADINNELKAIRAKLNSDDSIKQAIDELTTALRTKDEASVKRTIANHLGAFLSGTFSGVASSALIAFIKSFL